MAQAIALRATRKVDLLATDAGQVAMDLANDPVRICEVAFDICAKQRATLSILEESDFLNRFDGDTWDSLLDATIEAIIDFFPPARRDPLTKIWNRRRAVQNKMQADIAKRVGDEATLETMDKAASEAMQQFNQKLDELGAIRS